MLSLLLSLFLLTAYTNPAVKHFHKVSKTVFPRAVIETDLCPDTPKSDCWKDFLDGGEVWAGDVNDDGVDELVVFPGVGWSGTTGDTYFIYQKRGDNWAPLYLGENGPDVSGWLVPDPRFDILPVLRHGYHDLRVSEEWCLKWDGKHYVGYSDADYRKLSPDFFDKSNWEEAEIFWSIRYRGLRQMTIQPQWFPAPADWKASENVKVDDPEQNLVWIAFFKGGVWGVQGKRAFLLLPRPDYKGAERMELLGDWLMIYGEHFRSSADPPVAKYNRRTGELRILAKARPYWLLKP